MEQPIPEYRAPRRSPSHALEPEARLYAKKGAQSRRAAHGRERAADLLAALALPVLVLVLVVNRLSLGIAGRRQRHRQP
jgi:hypothetical protein